MAKKKTNKVWPIPQWEMGTNSETYMGSSGNPRIQHYKFKEKAHFKKLIARAYKK